MRKYRSLVAWQRARQLALSVLKSTDEAYHARSRAVFDQLRRAAISVEANIVEGYALGTPAQFKRHLRIAVGSAAETEILLELAAERGYLPADAISGTQPLVDETIATLFGLLRKGAGSSERGAE